MSLFFTSRLWLLCVNICINAHMHACIHRERRAFFVLNSPSVPTMSAFAVKKCVEQVRIRPNILPKCQRAWNECKTHVRQKISMRKKAQMLPNVAGAWPTESHNLLEQSYDKKQNTRSTNSLSSAKFKRALYTQVCLYMYTHNTACGWGQHVGNDSPILLIFLTTLLGFRSCFDKKFKIWSS